MKNQKSRISRCLKRSVRTLLFGAIGFVPSAWAEIECVPARAQATLDILGPAGPVVGIANFVIDDEPSVAGVVVSFLAPPDVQPDGTQRTLVKLDYDFGGGDTITGIGLGTLTPTTTPGVFSNDQQVTYVAGTGIYENVVSRFIATGTLSFLDNTAMQQGIGDICWSEIDPDDDDYNPDHDDDDDE
jgi:hypothetical protein